MKFPIWLFIAALLAGCGTAPQKMTDADRKAIRAVSVNNNISKPPEPFYLGPGSGPGMMFGALGAIVTEPGRQSARDSLRDFLAQNDISIERIVLEEFGTALRGSGKIQFADKPEPGAATVNIVIKLYGLSIPNGFSSNLVPVLSLECTMVDAAGKTLWRAGDRILTLGNPIEGRPGEAMRNDPKAIADAFRAAAKHVSANIVKEL